MKRILITPLDWGLGHATRCIPIIQELLNRKCDVSIAGSGESLELLKHEFPFLSFFSLPAYHPVYPSSGSMVWRMGAQLPKFIAVIRKEHVAVEQLVKDNKIDLVISDNRYGCWSARIMSVFITHQSNILMPRRFEWLGTLVRRVSDRMINRFSFCWVPDSPGSTSLAGELISSDMKTASNRVRYIGNLSRFRKSNVMEAKYDLVCIFSGPEPQRSLMEKIVVEQVLHSNLRCFIVRGLVYQSGKQTIPPEIDFADFLTSKELQRVIEQSDCVLARSGYSTVMDLARLGKKAIFIPTPGQTEQEYLAGRLRQLRIAFAMPQQSFDLNIAWKESKLYSGFTTIPDDTSLLKIAIDQIFSIPVNNQKSVADSTREGVLI